VVVHVVGGEVRLEIAGQIGVASAGRFRNSVNAALDLEPATVTIDVAEPPRSSIDRAVELSRTRPTTSLPSNPFVG
jgi:hypothetical protein